MGQDISALQAKGFTRQPDGTYAKVNSASHDVEVWDEKLQRGVKVNEPPKLNLTPRETIDESKLNKTERHRLHFLQLLRVPQLKVQSVTLKLADDCRFTADFTYIDENGRYVFEDVKGFQREDALIKMKFAARTFPVFRFIIVKKEGNGWHIDEVNP